MKSMTGFGRSSNARRVSPSKTKKTLRVAQESSSGAEIDVSIKSVNGRFLDLRVHLPREYAPVENDLKSLLAKTFARGTVDVYINRARSESEPRVTVNLPLAKAWFESYRALGRGLKLESELTLETLSRVPEIFQVETDSEVSENEIRLVKKLLGEAAAACDAERGREGASLEKDLSSHCERLEKLAETAEELKVEANAELEKRFKARLEDQLEKRGLKGGLDDQRIAHEVVIHLDRADISEELTRLREHLRAYRKLIKSDEPQGKKLDFYAQELLREVNTIGSKSHITRLTALVVEAKTLVEKIRELVQNVE